MNTNVLPRHFAALIISDIWLILFSIPDCKSRASAAAGTRYRNLVAWEKEVKMTRTRLRGIATRAVARRRLFRNAHARVAAG
ncbi:hypothetical protein [Burkholderia cepacia]|uniref:hypothetical protein n=1 Tax=Burkholderia cepacia TaxID=292 RepID=UPI000AE3699D|nr:hypothetical protein [Burkholderia cepacia]